MPVEIIETTDALTDLVQFRSSPVYEMIVSLHTLVAGRRHLEWAAKARATLGPEFWAELEAVYRPFHEGVVLFELPVDYKDHEDVIGFIDYVRAMDPATFVFYFIGRVIPRDELMRSNLDPEFVAQSLNEYCASVSHPLYAYVDTMKTMLRDVSAYQRRLTDVWERYWNEFFQGQVDALPAHWSQGIADKEHLLARAGGSALYEFITGKKKLPENLPSDYPITEIVCVPVYFVTWPSYLFFGYGNVTLLFNSEATLARLSEIEQRKDEAVLVTRALSDNTRLAILKLIVERDGHMHGKKIAEKLDLSPSSISRQLGQLRDSGLVIEERHDDQTVTYRLVKETITALADEILDYLYS
ncbi:MAG: ArsR/SmtB family transcription factor [Aggregatilineales bacterium]